MVNFTTESFAHIRTALLLLLHGWFTVTDQPRAAIEDILEIARWLSMQDPNCSGPLM